MYWNIHVLTKTGKEASIQINGRKGRILADLEADHLSVISMAPNFAMTLMKILDKGCLTASQLRSFFIDFSRMMKSGLSISETIRTLWETSSDERIKTALEKIRISINLGASLKEAFESAEVFPSIVSSSLDAGEKSGQIPVICEKLGNYFEYMEANKKQILGALIYPLIAFIALTISSIVISVKLLPQLAFLMTDEQKSGFSMRLLSGYANLMKDDWCLISAGLALVMAALVWWPKRYQQRFIKYVFRVPVLGNLYRDLELTRLFLNLAIYIRSGISITEALTNISMADNGFMPQKLIHIRDHINSGATLGEAFERDPFFPPFVHQSLKKADETGKRSEYLHEIYKFFDAKSKDSLNAVIKLINPVLMIMAFSFAGFIAYFYVLIYKDMGAMATGIYR